MGEDGATAVEMGAEVGGAALVIIKEAPEEEGTVGTASLESSSSDVSFLGSSNK